MQKAFVHRANHRARPSMPEGMARRKAEGKPPRPGGNGAASLIGGFATDPLGLVGFRLTPQTPHLTIAPVDAVSATAISGNCQGGSCAVHARLDGAVHQPGMRGARPLAACRQGARGPLQQLRRAAAQCSAPAGSEAAAPAAPAEQLPPVAKISLRSLGSSPSRQPTAKGCRDLPAQLRQALY
jgi:hypothetical protein